MSDAPGKLEARAAELRRAFDRSFAEAPRHRDLLADDLLGIRLGAEPYAVRLSEIAGLFADKPVSPVPSQVRELLGVAGFRGAILPVYDLRLLLGYAHAAPARWLVVAAARPVALAFDAFDGHLRLARAAIAAAPQGRHAHVHEIARAEEARPVVKLASVLDAIERRCLEPTTTKEPQR